MAAKKPEVKAPAKVVDYKKLSLAELADKVSELRDEAVALKRGTRTGDVQNVRAYKFKRRELARALTAQRAMMAEGEK